MTNQDVFFIYIDMEYFFLQYVDFSLVVNRAAKVFFSLNKSYFFSVNKSYFFSQNKSYFFSVKKSNYIFSTS